MNRRDTRKQLTVVCQAAVLGLAMRAAVGAGVFEKGLKIADPDQVAARGWWTKEPGWDLAAIEGRIANQLGLNKRSQRDAGVAALGERGQLRGGQITEPHIARPAWRREREGELATVRRKDKARRIGR